jgi:hypothetical protein
MNLWLERLVVPYEYPVYFTVDVFSAANPDVLRVDGGDRPGARGLRA